MTVSAALKDLILRLRDDPVFPQLLQAVEAPRIPKFRKSKAAEVEQARAEWIYESGKQDQHDKWLYLLTGKTSREGVE